MPGKLAKGFLGEWVAVTVSERLFLIMGEAEKRLREELCGRYRGVLRRKIASPRARLAHGYHSVEGAILWDEAAVSIRDIRSTITVMLRGLGAP